MRPISKLIFMLATIALASTASAAIMTVTCSTLNGPTELNSKLVCPQFNGSNLQGISIALSGGVSGSITLTKQCLRDRNWNRHDYFGVYGRTSHRLLHSRPAVEGFPIV